MLGAQSPEEYQRLLLPKGSAEAISRFEALTEAEVRGAALSVLDNVVFRHVLVDFQEQVIQSLRITPPGAEQERLCLMLAAIDTLLGAFIGQAFATRGSTAGG